MKRHGCILSFFSVFVKYYLRHPPHGGRAPIILLRKTPWAFFFLMVVSVAGVLGFSSIPNFTWRLVRNWQLSWSMSEVGHSWRLFGSNSFWLLLVVILFRHRCAIRKYQLHQVWTQASQCLWEYGQEGCSGWSYVSVYREKGYLSTFCKIISHRINCSVHWSRQCAQQQCS